MCRVNALIFATLLKLRLDSQFPANTLLKSIENMCGASGLFVQMLNYKTGLPPSQNPTNLTTPTVTLYVLA